MPEPRNDARDDFSVAMLTDQYMGAPTPITDRDHQLLRVPKGKNDVAPFPIQRIDRLMSARLTTHRLRDSTNDRRGHRRQQGTLHPLGNSLLQTLLVPDLSTQHSAPIVFVTHWSHPEIAWHEGVDTSRPSEAILHASPSPQSFHGLTPRYDPHFEWWRAGAQSPPSSGSS